MCVSGPETYWLGQKVKVMAGTEITVDGSLWVPRVMSLPLCVMVSTSDSVHPFQTSTYLQKSVESTQLLWPCPISADYSAWSAVGLEVLDQDEGQGWLGCVPSNFNLTCILPGNMHRTAEQAGDLWRQLCLPLYHWKPISAIPQIKRNFQGVRVPPAVKMRVLDW